MPQIAALPIRAHISVGSNHVHSFLPRSSMEAPAWCSVTGWHRHRHHAGPSPSVTTRSEGRNSYPATSGDLHPGHQWGLSRPRTQFDRSFAKISSNTPSGMLRGTRRCGLGRYNPDFTGEAAAPSDYGARTEKHPVARAPRNAWIILRLEWGGPAPGRRSKTTGGRNEGDEVDRRESVGVARVPLAQWKSPESGRQNPSIRRETTRSRPAAARCFQPSRRSSWGAGLP